MNVQSALCIMLLFNPNSTDILIDSEGIFFTFFFKVKCEILFLIASFTGHLHPLEQSQDPSQDHQSIIIDGGSHLLTLLHSATQEIEDLDHR